MLIQFFIKVFAAFTSIQNKSKMTVQNRSSERKINNLFPYGHCRFSNTISLILHWNPLCQFSPIHILTFCYSRFIKIVTFLSLILPSDYLLRQILIKFCNHNSFPPTKLIFVTPIGFWAWLSIMTTDDEFQYHL
jgi:hypothetical protein